MEELLGVTQTSMYQGEGTYFNTTVFWTRQDLPYVQVSMFLSIQLIAACLQTTCRICMYNVRMLV